jgi:YegS/Rv2252/BmrU family lipid kinase
VKVLFVVNRRSGAQRRDDVTTVIRETCAWEHEIAEIGERADLDAIVRRAEGEHFDVVYAVGGDGTVHNVAKRLIGTPLALGIVPTGSGNGLARHLGMPMNVRRALRACASQRFATIDTAVVNGIPFIGTMGIGFDAWVAETFATRGARGLQTYVRVALSGLLRYRPETYKLGIDGQQMERSALIVAIANASQYGNNARIAPLASLQDGVLDVVIIERRSMSAMARLFTGSLQRAAGVTMLRGKKITIFRPAAGPAHVDGEPVTLPEKLSISIVPQSLRILLPDNARQF